MDGQTNRQTHDDSTYRASIASRGKNQQTVYNADASNDVKCKN